MRKKIFTLSSTLLILHLGLIGLKAQQAPPPARAGVLILESERPESQAIRGLREGLKALGYNEKRNILLEIRNAKADPGALKALAGELVGRKVGLLFTIGTRATQAAQAATSEIPVVFVHAVDPMASGFIKSMTNPGGNLTGVASFAQQATEKRLEIFKEIVPKMRRVFIFYDVNNPFVRENLGRTVGPKLGLELVEKPIKSAEELKNSIHSLQQREGDGLFHIPDHLVESQADFLLQVTRQKALPTMFHEEIWTIKGALAAYGPSYYHMGRQAAGFVDKILKGKRPQELPVERSSKFELIINYRVANAMGLTVPPAVLKKADKVIR